MLWVAWPPPLFIHHALLSTLIGPLVFQLTPELREMPLSDWWIFWHLRWDKSHSGSLLAAHTRPGHSSMASHFSHLPRVLRSYTIVTIVWNKCEKLMHFIAVQCCRDQFVLFVYLAVTKYCNLEIISSETRGPPVTGQQWPAMTGWQIVSAPASTQPMSDVTWWPGSRENISTDSWDPITNQRNYVWSSSASPTLCR